MKKLKVLFASIICIAMFSEITTAYDKGNIGFGAGTTFHSHRDPMLKTAVINYFRLYFKAENDVWYFLHRERGSFMVDEGDVDAAGSQTAEAVGVSVNFGALNLDFMVGRAVAKVDGNINSGGAWRAIPNADIMDMDSSDAFAELGVSGKYVKNNASLHISVAYRYHALKEDILISDSSAALPTDGVNNLSSINLGVGASYMF